MAYLRVDTYPPLILLPNYLQILPRPCIKRHLSLNLAFLQHDTERSVSVHLLTNWSNEMASWSISNEPL